MRSYVAIVDNEGEAGFGIVFPDLPGCVAEAATFDDAVERARETLALFVAEAAELGYPLPEPRQPDAIRKLPDVCKSRGAAPMVVPLAAPAGDRERVNIMMDKNLLAEIDRAAGRDGLTRSGFLERAAATRLRTETSRPTQPRRRRSLRRVKS